MEGGWWETILLSVRVQVTESQFTNDLVLYTTFWFVLNLLVRALLQEQVSVG